jgi:hypothetical protein
LEVGILVGIIVIIVFVVLSCINPPDGGGDNMPDPHEPWQDGFGSE